MKRILLFSALVMLAAALVSFSVVYAQNASGSPIPAGLVAAHMIGRMVVDADGTAELIGYYPFLEGIPGPLFSDPSNISEQTAYFTFRSSRLSVSPISNGPLTHLRVIPADGDSAVVLSVYFNATPSQDFSNPDSFSAGMLIGQFQAHGSLTTIVPFTTTINAGSYTRLTTADFTFGGTTYNLGLLASNITVQLNGAPYDFELGYVSASIPFGGSALAAGSVQAPPAGDSRQPQASPKKAGDGK